MTRESARGGGGSGPGGATAAAVAISAAAAGQAGAENFPVALRLLPREHRRRLAAVYGFARSVDDMGDEAAPEQRLALLDEIEADLDRLYRALPPPGGAGAGLGGAGLGGAGLGGELAGADGDGPRLAVVRALGPVVADCAIPAQLFRDLIEANRQDQVVLRYPAFDDLLGYCRLSANPVGRIVLRVFGAVTPRREAMSDQVCTALQLVEHLQDVAEDRRSGRVYLPAEDLDRFGCAEGDLDGMRAAPRVRALIRFEAGRAGALLDQGAPLIGTLRGPARAAVAGYVAGGRAAIAAIAAAGHDVLRAAPKPARWRLAKELARAYATGR